MIEKGFAPPWGDEEGRRSASHGVAHTECIGHRTSPPKWDIRHVVRKSIRCHGLPRAKDHSTLLFSPDPIHVLMPFRGICSKDLPSGACVLQRNRKREPGRRRIRTYPAGMGALERSSGRGQYGLVPFNGFSLRYCPGGPVGCSRVDSTPLKPTSRGRCCIDHPRC